MHNSVTHIDRSTTQKGSGTVAGTARRVLRTTVPDPFLTPYAVVRIALGLLLLTAAGLKGHELATEPVAETGLLTSRWFLIGVVEFELFFGLWLVAGLYARLTSTVALLCFGGFAVVSLYKALSGEATCGCFGKVPVNPWYTFLLDTAAVAALSWCRPQRGPSEAVPGNARLLFRPAEVAIVCLAVGVPSAWAMGSYRPAALGDRGDIFGDSEFVVLEPETWVGKRFPLLNHIDIGEQLAESEWILLLYRHGCPKCRQAIAALEQQAEDTDHRSDARSMALVETPPYSVNRPCDAAAISIGRLSDTKEWLGSTPVKVVLKDGNVTRVSGHNL